MNGRLHSVSTLLMTVGRPQRPRSTGNGGRSRGTARSPSMLERMTDSSPQT